jgi:hypothetical protein
MSVGTVRAGDGRVNETISFAGSGRRSVLIIVIDHVDHTHMIVPFAAIGGVAAPVIDNVINIVDGAEACVVNERMVEPWITAVVVREEIMMEGSVGASPYTTISVGAFAVNGFLKGLGDYAILHSKIGVPVAADALVNGPGTAEVVEDDSGRIIDGDGIVFGVTHIAETDAYEAHDNIVSLDDEGIVRQADAVPRSGLSIDSDVTIVDTQLFGEMDGTGNIEDNSPCACLGDSISECSGRGSSGIGIIGILERSDSIDGPSITACDLSSPALYMPTCRYQLRIGVDSRLIGLPGRVTCHECGKTA